jgi:hypothetical protein
VRPGEGRALERAGQIEKEHVGLISTGKEKDNGRPEAKDIQGKKEQAALASQAQQPQLDAVFAVSPVQVTAHRLSELWLLRRP